MHPKWGDRHEKWHFGTSPVDQWLRLCTSTARGTGSIPGQGSFACCALWQKKCDIFEEVQTAREYSHYEVKFLGLNLIQTITMCYESQTITHLTSFASSKPLVNILTYYRLRKKKKPIIKDTRRFIKYLLYALNPAGANFLSDWWEKMKLLLNHTFKVTQTVLSTIWIWSWANLIAKIKLFPLEYFMA